MEKHPQDSRTSALKRGHGDAVMAGPSALKRGHGDAVMAGPTALKRGHGDAVMAGPSTLKRGHVGAVMIAGLSSSNQISPVKKAKTESQNISQS